MPVSSYKLKGNVLFLADTRGGIVSEKIYKNILAPVNDRGFNINTSDHQQMYSKLEDLFKKTKGAGYHYQLILSEINPNLDINTYKNNKDVFESYPNKHFENDVIIYEVEAFLFQVKSSLDILMQLMAYKYTYLKNNKAYSISKLSFKSENGYAGKVIIDKFRYNGRNDIGDLLSVEVENWIQELVSWRDAITHRTNLQGFYCFILKNPDIGKFVLQKPIMPSGVEVTQYCKQTLHKLLRLENTIIEKYLL